MASNPMTTQLLGRTITSQAVFCLVSRHPCPIRVCPSIEFALCVWIWFHSETPCTCCVQPLDQTLQIILDCGLVVRQFPCATFGGKECVWVLGKHELHLAHFASETCCVVSCPTAPSHRCSWFFASGDVMLLPRSAFHSIPRSSRNASFIIFFAFQPSGGEILKHSALDTQNPQADVHAACAPSLRWGRPLRLFVSGHSLLQHSRFTLTACHSLSSPTISAGSFTPELFGDCETLDAHSIGHQVSHPRRYPCVSC